MKVSTTTTTGGGRAGPARRPLLALAAVVGLGLVAAPFAFGMFTKAPKGATMIAQFKPFMTVSRLDGYRGDIAEINAGVRQTDTSVAVSLDGSRAAFSAAHPEFVSFDRQWPAIDHTMSRLMSQVRGNLGNYLAVAALPSFRLFPWFFVIPGALIA